MDTPSFAMRADATPRIGFGHVSRCLALARELRHADARVMLLAAEPSAAVAARCRELGVELHALPAFTSQRADAGHAREALGNDRPHWLIVDHYDLGNEWETMMRPVVKSIMAIDDLVRVHDCDVLLDQNWVGPATATRYDSVLPTRCARLLGPHFALLGSEYAEQRPHRDPKQTMSRVFVSFGGSDPTNETAKALRALSRSEFARLSVDVVLGPTHDSPEQIRELVARRPGTELHDRPRSLAALIAAADFGLGATGVSVWERLCLGLPSAVTAVAENQVAAALALAEAGYVQWVGEASAVTEEDYAAALARPLRSIAALPTLVDGLGVSRTAALLLGAQRNVKSFSHSSQWQ
jgi:UDP-2,4-diacetamido-2,4,6-trideoxy-beta-L-altropyranose hydrolase